MHISLYIRSFLHRNLSNICRKTVEIFGFILQYRLCIIMHNSAHIAVCKQFFCTKICHISAENFEILIRDKTLPFPILSYTILWSPQFRRPWIHPSIPSQTHSHHIKRQDTNERNMIKVRNVIHPSIHPFPHTHNPIINAHTMLFPHST